MPARGSLIVQLLLSGQRSDRLGRWRSRRPSPFQPRRVPRRRCRNATAPPAPPRSPRRRCSPSSAPPATEPPARGWRRRGARRCSVSACSPRARRRLRTRLRPTRPRRPAPERCASSTHSSRPEQRASSTGSTTSRSSSAAGEQARPRPREGPLPPARGRHRPHQGGLARDGAEARRRLQAVRGQAGRRAQAQGRGPRVPDEALARPSRRGRKARGSRGPARPECAHPRRRCSGSSGGCATPWPSSWASWTPTGTNASHSRMSGSSCSRRRTPTGRPRTRIPSSFIPRSTRRRRAMPRSSHSRDRRSATRARREARRTPASARRSTTEWGRPERRARAGLGRRGRGGLDQEPRSRGEPRRQVYEARRLRVRDRRRWPERLGVFGAPKS